MIKSPQNNPDTTPATPLIIWLFAVAALVFGMVVVGGVTRLTGSGLSIVEWRPLAGTLPPMSDMEWQRIFALYQQSPEFIQVNYTMTLAEFKMIFFWEYVHRLLGRLIGLAYALPLAVFFIKGYVPKGFGVRLSGLLILGGMQGVIGWWMVASGLAEDATVSQYRLVIHLSLALLILSLLVWTALDLKNGKAGWPAPHPLGVGLTLALTIIAGAFVAGLDAGLIYNEYPLMGGSLIPPEYGDKGMLDAFENPASAQFHHRVLAVLTLVGLLSLWWRALRQGLLLHGSVMLGLVVIQFMLGIGVLLAAVPPNLGVLHQAGATLLLLAVTWYLHGAARQQT